MYEKTSDRARGIWRVETSGKWFVGGRIEQDGVGNSKGWATLRSDAVAPETRGKDGAKWHVFQGASADADDGWRDDPNVRIGELNW